MEQPSRPEVALSSLGWVGPAHQSWEAENLVQMQPEPPHLSARVPSRLQSVRAKLLLAPMGIAAEKVCRSKDNRDR